MDKKAKRTSLGALERAPTQAMLHGSSKTPTPDEARLVVRIIGYRGVFPKRGDSYIAFLVLCRKGNLLWAVKRRYTHFESLHAKLKKKFDNIPALPSKGLFSTMTARSMEDRRQGLEKCLLTIVNSRAAESDEIAEFLRDDGDSMNDEDDDESDLASNDGESIRESPGSRPTSGYFGSPDAEKLRSQLAEAQAQIQKLQAALDVTKAQITRARADEPADVASVRDQLEAERQIRQAAEAMLYKTLGALRRDALAEVNKTEQLDYGVLKQMGSYDSTMAKIKSAAAQA